MLEIPEFVSDDELVLRTIFSPANFNPKGKLRPNYMRPQFSRSDEEDESIASNKISVTRYTYADIEFCRDHARRHSSESRNYWGFASFQTKNVRTLGCDVVYKPVSDNLAHANVVYPYRIPVLKEGETISPEYSLLISNMVKTAKIYQDPNPLNEKWEGEDLK